MLKRDLYYESIPTKSLRDHVRYLGNILGIVIKKQEDICGFGVPELNKVGVACVKYFLDINSYVSSTLSKSSKWIPTETFILD